MGSLFVKDKSAIMAFEETRLREMGYRQVGQGFSACRLAMAMLLPML